jgi:propionyl-CoA carboxylase beta chain
LVLVDVPGFTGTDQEWNGIIVHGTEIALRLSKQLCRVMSLVKYGGAYE